MMDVHLSPQQTQGPQMRTRITQLLTALAATALVVGAAGAAQARAATDPAVTVTPGTTTLTVTGHGWGHGHGMSQYGARGAALAGLTSAQILAFYYPGT